MKYVYLGLFAGCVALMVYNPEAIFLVATLSLYFFACYEARRNA